MKLPCFSYYFSENTFLSWYTLLLCVFLPPSPSHWLFTNCQCGQWLPFSLLPTPAPPPDCRHRHVPAHHCSRQELSSAPTDRWSYFTISRHKRQQKAGIENRAAEMGHGVLGMWQGAWGMGSGALGIDYRAYYCEGSVAIYWLSEGHSSI